MLRLLAVASLLAVNTPALAIEYTISGTGSGSLDGVAWSGDFTITADGGPPKSFQDGLIIDPLDESTVTIGGKTVTITAPTRFGNNTAVFPSIADDIFFDVPSAISEINFLLAGVGFNFQKGFGPLTSVDVNGDLSGVATSGGALSLTPSGVVTFASEAAPEPSTWAMMLVGFVGVAFAGWRSKTARRALTA
jgi:PEP-CTERM motif